MRETTPAVPVSKVGGGPGVGAWSGATFAVLVVVLVFVNIFMSPTPLDVTLGAGVGSVGVSKVPAVQGWEMPTSGALSSVPVDFDGNSTGGEMVAPIVGPGEVTEAESY